ncbi:MAG: 3-deoxy-7-phosphoheptulonate synthase [Candidatus Thermoplasmatota archaeon]|jgi:3-deoxy-7-phosphoheptulonate synthase|nr:3-deoxy-7-phosphoheptulonate synthase [Candidatus Thermoplasmatota archaeon]MCL5791340.1 3-deoxy-7-phosphoheptulonate synthase [Candidatus Thermoplasmatota archaeon]
MMSEMLKVRELFPEGQIQFIAGPCAVESEVQINSTAKFLSGLGVRIMRGGAFKPRTAPESFQGLAEEGLKIMRRAADRFGMLVVTEVMDEENLDLVEEYTDIFQIGSRNCQNFSLLKKVGRRQKPVLIKRGFGNTIEEFYQATRYISREGNDQIIMVERGIRTFEESTRFTLDISAVPVLKGMVNYPVIVDPSHPAGKREYVPSLSYAAVGAGADGLMIEVHPDPERAMSDARQQVNFETFEEIYRKSLKIRESMI